MICEMCGNNVPSTRPVFIEGTKLNVCPACARFGKEGTRQGDSEGGPSAQIIEQRLEKRERRMKTKDVYSGTEQTELVEDYGDVIRKARTEKGMDLEQFAASIFEKKGTLAKIEAYNLAPDEKLIKKLEKALGIKLTEQVARVGKVGGTTSTRMSLGDFIKKE